MEFATMMELLGSGFVFTLQIFLTTLVGALPLGVVVALARMSRFKPLALLARAAVGKGDDSRHHCVGHGKADEHIPIGGARVMLQKPGQINQEPSAGKGNDVMQNEHQ